VELTGPCAGLLTNNNKQMLTDAWRASASFFPVLIMSLSRCHATHSARADWPPRTLLHRLGAGPHKCEARPLNSLAGCRPIFDPLQPIACCSRPPNLLLISTRSGRQADPDDAQDRDARFARQPQPVTAPSRSAEGRAPTGGKVNDQQPPARPTSIPALPGRRPRVRGRRFVRGRRRLRHTPPRGGSARPRAARVGRTRPGCEPRDHGCGGPVTDLRPDGVDLSRHVAGTCLRLRMRKPLAARPWARRSVPDLRPIRRFAGAGVEQARV
jgi:hypothetical protein